MVSGVIEVNKFAQIGLLLKVRFVDKPLTHFHPMIPGGIKWDRWSEMG